jgi:hypothetical protein
MLILNKKSFGMKTFCKIEGTSIVLVGHKCVGTCVMDAEQNLYL